MNPIFKFFSSLRLTIVLLAFSIAIVFFGTLDQANWGIKHTQELYFESLVVMSPVVALCNMLFSQEYLPQLEFIRVPLPGGYTLGALLLVNLVCAHFRFFRPSWKKTGIVMIHGGVVALLISGFLTSALQKDSLMQLVKGGVPVNYSTDFYDYEIAVIDRSEAEFDTVTAIDFAHAKKRDQIALPEKPFNLRIHAAFDNAAAVLRSSMRQQHESFARMDRSLPQAQQEQIETTLASLGDSNIIAISESGEALVQADGMKLLGFAGRMDGVLQRQAPSYETERGNVPGSVIEVLDEAGNSLGAWILSAGFGPNIPAQGFIHEGKRYDLALRSKRHYYPFSLSLKEARHDIYPGTDIPKNFSSDVAIVHSATGEQRSAFIYMNHPLRYEGLAFFQYQMQIQTGTSGLQVVRNPSWQLPYYSVALVGIGMTVHFIIHLFGFAQRMKRERGKA